MYCYQCGNSMPDDSVFCQSCGAQTVPAAQEAAASVETMPYRMHSDDPEAMPNIPVKNVSLPPLNGFRGWLIFFAIHLCGTMLFCFVEAVANVVFLADFPISLVASLIAGAATIVSAVLTVIFFFRRNIRFRLFYIITSGVRILVAPLLLLILEIEAYFPTGYLLREIDYVQLIQMIGTTVIASAYFYNSNRVDITFNVYKRTYPGEY